MRARGLKPATAVEILGRADERAIWYRLLNSEDDAVVLRAMMFLMTMRDGRPAQQINVTSVGVTITAEEIQRARAIARQIMQNAAAAGSPMLEGGQSRDGTR